jgi:hypothetical protein
MQSNTVRVPYHSPMAQGLGEGPDQVLVGTHDGCICLTERADQPPPFRWTLVNQPAHGKVTSMAAVDRIVVAGYADGEMRIFRMDNSVS